MNYEQVWEELDRIEVRKTHLLHLLHQINLGAEIVPVSTDENKVQVYVEHFLARQRLESLE